MRNNTSLKGGIGYIHLDSKITISDSEIIDNFATLGGVFYVNDEGRFECSGVRFQGNFAVDGNIMFIMNSMKKSILRDVSLVGNKYIDKLIFDQVLEDARLELK